MGIIIIVIENYLNDSSSNLPLLASLYSVNILGKRTNPTIHPPAMDK